MAAFFRPRPNSTPGYKTWATLFKELFCKNETALIFGFTRG